MKTLVNANLSERYLITQVGELKLVFSATQVTEIVRVEKNKILSLPFYSTLMLGVVNHNGCLMPLVSAGELLHQDQIASQELLTVIRFKYSSNDVGVVIERALGSMTKQQLPPDLLNGKGREGTFVMMNAQLIPTEIWQPQY